MTPNPPMPDTPWMALCTARAQALQRQMRRIARERMRDLPLLNPALQVQTIGWRPLRVSAPRGPGQACAAADSSAADGWMAVGVLLTPWSMNLVQLPLDATAAALLPAPGAKAVLDCGGLQAEFIGAAEPLPWDDIDAVEGSDTVDATLAAARLRAGAAGTHGAQCSLFSPVLQFADQGQACAVAHEVLRLMRQFPVHATEPTAPGRAPEAGPDARSGWTPPAMPALATAGNEAATRPSVGHVPATERAGASAATPSRRGFLFGGRPSATAPGLPR